MIHGNLHGRVPGEYICPEDISLNAGSEKYAISIADGSVLLDHVAGISSRNETDTEVLSLRRIAISTEPVRTEPVTTSAAEQSYAAARIVRASVSYQEVAVQVVIGSAAYQNA